MTKGLSGPAEAGEPGWAPVFRSGIVGALLVLILTAPTLTHLTSVGRLDTNDGRYSIWNIAWIDHALLEDPANLLNANIFWPHRGTLAYSELNLVAGIFGLPWYAVTGSPLAALNGAVAVALLLSFVLMAALVRRLTGSESAGLVSAVAFTFCPYVSARTPHIQLLMVFVFPLVMLSWHRLAAGPGVARGIELGVTVAIAALACGYYGIFAGCMLAFVAVCLGGHSKKHWMALTIAMMTAAAIVYPVYRLFSAARALSGATLLSRSGEAAEYSANVAAYLASGAASHVWWLAALERWQPRSEVLFPGIGIVLLAGVGVMAARRAAHTRRAIGIYLALAALACWASFGPAGGLYRVLELAVPGMSLLRAPARIGIVVTFALAIVAGYGAAALAQRRRWIAPLLVPLLACELSVHTAEWGWPSWPLRRQPPLSAAYQKLVDLPRGVLVEYPFPYESRNYHNHGGAMFWSTYHWLPLVNGYSDVIPPDFDRIALPINYFPDPRSFEIMKEREVRYVLWHVDRYDEASRRIIAGRLQEFAAYLRPIVHSDDEWLFEIVDWP